MAIIDLLVKKFISIIITNFVLLVYFIIFLITRIDIVAILLGWKFNFGIDFQLNHWKLLKI